VDNHEDTETGNLLCETVDPGAFVWKTDVNSIDYSHPELYLTAGNQSDLNKRYFDEINRQIKIKSNDIEGIRTIFNWKQGYFKAYAAGGALIGQITIDQIMEKRSLGGCHDHGLALVSILRSYGFPAVMVDAAGIQWAFDYREGKAKGFRGHVFVEAYVKNRWILIDSTSGEYVENYDPSNLVIPIKLSVETRGHLVLIESKGYFALFKGLDPAGYGITSFQQLKEHLEEFARRAESIEISFPQYLIKKLRSADSCD
jgi:hypothetical protein